MQYVSIQLLFSHCFERIVVPRVPSEEACSRTVHNRVRLMRGVRTATSGESDYSSATQLAAELWQSSREERELVLKEAGILGSSSVSAEECIAMKATLSIPWHKLQHIWW